MYVCGIQDVLNVPGDVREIINAYGNVIEFGTTNIRLGVYDCE